MYLVVSWAGPYPQLCRKRPTADLVSRKVLTPLLGQMCICIAIQAVVFIAVRKQSWYAYNAMCAVCAYHPSVKM